MDDVRRLDGHCAAMLVLCSARRRIGGQVSAPSASHRGMTSRGSRSEREARRVKPDLSAEENVALLVCIPG
jgi:hypothetical protein